MRLIDADANIETMKKCAANPESEQALLCYRFTQRILEEAPTVQLASPWHRVEERLPNVGELVVGLDADGHAEITMLSEAKCWLTYGLWIHNLGCYVWWMPLPEPPKEDA